MAESKAAPNDVDRRIVFGRLLADALKSRHMKQEDLAAALGITQSSVSGWINGKYEPAAATVFSVERFLDLDPGSLSRPLGYLPVEPASASVSVEGAIAQSPLLDEDQKAALSSMYRVLVRQGSARPRLAAAPARPARPRTAARGRSVS